MESKKLFVLRFNLKNIEVIIEFKQPKNTNLPRK